MAEVELEFPPNLDDGEQWLPSNVLSDEEGEEELELGDLSLTGKWVAAPNEGGQTQEVKSPKSTLRAESTSSGSSPSCSERENGSDAWDLVDMKLKLNEVDWKPLVSSDFKTGYSTTWSSPNSNIHEGIGSGNALEKWNSTQESSATPAKKYMQHKPCPVSSGWSQHAIPMQGCSTGIANPSYPPWASVQGRGSGMKAVFLGSNGTGRESGGTGVFLPRRAGNGFDSKKKKKSGCSTVLLPYKVVQALNLNLQKLSSRPIVHDLYGWNHGSGCGRRQIDNNKPLPGNGCCEQQKKPFHPVDSNIQALPPEITLPQDWTY